MDTAGHMIDDLSEIENAWIFNLTWIRDLTYVAFNELIQKPTEPVWRSLYAALKYRRVCKRKVVQNSNKEVDN